MNSPDVFQSRTRNQTVTRRSWLAGLAGGLTTAGLLKAGRRLNRPSLPANAPNLTSGDLLWDVALPSGYQDDSGGLLLANGAIVKILAAQTSYRFALASIDAQSGALRWLQSYSDDQTLNGQAFNSVTLFNGLLYVFLDSGFMMVNPGDGSFVDVISFKAQAQERISLITLPVQTSTGFICATTDNLFSFDFTGAMHWMQPFAMKQNGFASPVLANGLVICDSSDGRTQYNIIAFSESTGSLVWSVPAVVTSQFAIGLGNVYASLNNNTVLALDIATGTRRWSWTDQSAQPYPSTPLVYNGAVYVSSAGTGTIHALDGVSGTLLWSMPTPGPLGTTSPSETQDTASLAPFSIEDGVMYFSSLTNAYTASEICAASLASKGTEFVQFSVSDLAWIAGVQNGVTYFLHGQGSKFGAAKLQDQLHAFFCQSSLMVEDYQASGDSYKPSTTSYRTHIQLLDPQGNPRINTAVKIWASDTLTISSGGVIFTVDDQGKNAWLKTDGAGELSIITPASDISCPALYLWSSFMDQNEAMVIYPDQDTLETLSNVSGDQLSKGKTYDSSDLLPANASAADLASTIKNLMGGAKASFQTTKAFHRQQALANRQNRSKRSLLVSQNPDSYIAFPGSTTNLLYQPAIAPTGRTYVPSPVQSWTTSIVDGGITYQVTTGEQASAPQLLGSSFFDFVSNAVHGVENVAKIVVTEAKNVIVHTLNTVIKGAEGLYTFTLDTVEHAAAVVSATLKAIVGGIKRAVEWLSYLFDWNSVLSVKKTLHDAVLARLGNIKTAINHLSTDAIADVHIFFGGLESNVAQLFSSAAATLGGKSAGTEQKNGNNPQTIFSAGGSGSYAKGHWLMSKTQDNSPAATVSANSGLDGFLQNYKNMATQIGTLISKDANSDFANLGPKLTELGSRFSSLLSNPAAFATLALTTLLDVIQDIAVLLLQVVDAAIETLLLSLSSIVDALIGIISTPIQIPVISDLYSWIAQSELSFLDLLCLIVAIPTSIIYNGLSSSQNNSAATLGSASLLSLGAIVTGCIYLILDPISDLIESLPGFAKGFYLTCSLVYYSLGTAGDLVSNGPDDTLFDSLQVIPNVITGVGYALDATSAKALEAFKPIWSGASPWVSLTYGVIMALFVMNYSNNGIMSATTTAENLIGFAPSWFKTVGQGPTFSPGRIFLGVVDALCDTTSLIINAVTTIDGPTITA